MFDKRGLIKHFNSGNSNSEILYQNVFGVEIFRDQTKYI